MNRLLVAVAAIGGLAGAAAARPTFTQQTTKGHQIAFSFDDTEGCVETFGQIIVIPVSSQNPGAPDSGFSMGVSLTQLNLCTFEVLISAEANLTDGFTFSHDPGAGQITAASVTSTVPLVDDFSGAPHTLAINVTLTAVEQAGKSFSQDRAISNLGFFKLHDRLLCANSSATGTVSLDGGPNILGTPDPTETTYCYITSGSLFRTH
jgi:hypothetical protein